MHPSSCVIPNTRLNANNRKRKIDTSDFEDKSSHKMFLTEEKLIQNMQTLSLDISLNSTTSQEDLKKEIDQDEYKISQGETRYELHQLFKDNLGKDGLQDKFIIKLCDLERKKFSMQIVPYMPIHPAQLNNNNSATMEEKEQKIDNEILSSMEMNESKKDNDDHLFKRPLTPTPYTVEEPTENTNKRTLRMKRSYSQSVRYNSNLSVVELKDDKNDYVFYSSQSDYFIVEPSTPALAESSTDHCHSSLPSNKSSLQISEYFDFSKSNVDDRIDMQSNVLFDVYDEMDDEV